MLIGVNMKKIVLFLVILLSCSNMFSQTSTKQDALVLYNNGKYREAIKVCEEELVVTPNNVESYVVMCWALVKNRQYAEAEQRAMEQFQKYVASAPESSARVGSAYYFMGEIFIKQARFQHADIALSAAVKKEPSIDSWWIRLGYAREKAGNYLESFNAYEEALRLNPSSIDAARGRERASAELQ